MILKLPDFIKKDMIDAIFVKNHYDQRIKKNGGFEEIIEMIKPAIKQHGGIIVDWDDGTIQLLKNSAAIFWACEYYDDYGAIYLNYEYNSFTENLSNIELSYKNFDDEEEKENIKLD